MDEGRDASKTPPNPGVYLLAAKFAFQHDGVDSIAIPVQIPVSPEFPVRTSASIAFPLAVLKVSPLVTVRCLLRKALAEGEKDEDNWATLQVVLVPNPLLPDVGEAGLLVSAFQFLFQGGGQFSSQDDVAGYMDVEMNLLPVLNASFFVGSTSVNMKWQWREGMATEDGAFQEIGTFPFTFYWTIDRPNLPWGWPSHGGIVPPVPLLRHACAWASGTGSTQSAMEKIVAAIWNETRFRYSYSQAYTAFEVDSHGLPALVDGVAKITFDATALGEHLRGFFGDGLDVNCADLSHIVMLLGNLLGCKVGVGILANNGNPSAGFDLNPHWQLGATNLVESHSFIYHEVAYIGDEFNEDAVVFDPCVAFGSDIPTEFVHGWRLSDYIKRLVKDQNTCSPCTGLRSWDIRVI